jgi:hypothetical protein
MWGARWSGLGSAAAGMGASTVAACMVGAAATTADTAASMAVVDSTAVDTAKANGLKGGGSGQPGCFTFRGSVTREGSQFNPYRANIFPRKSLIWATLLEGCKSGGL